MLEAIEGAYVSALRGRRILVIEDEILLAFEMIDELERLGAQPLGPVPSVGEALQFLMTDKPIDAALLNVHLRGEASVPVADALTTLAVPFLFVTGNDEFVREHYPEVPCHPKPADMPKLIAALELLMT